jgi:hypothetical protein
MDLRVPGKIVLKSTNRFLGNPGVLPAVRNLFAQGKSKIFNTLLRSCLDFGFARNNDFIRVVLFIMSERQIADIDLDYYRLRKVRLSDGKHLIVSKLMH